MTFTFNLEKPGKMGIIMKMKILMLLCLLPLMGGCHSKLLGDRDGAPYNPGKEGLSSVPSTSECPEIEEPQGFVATYNHGRFANNFDVTVEPGLTTWVLLSDVNTWFKLKNVPSGAYWYSKPEASVVRYQGPSLTSKNWCIIQFIPEP